MNFKTITNGIKAGFISSGYSRTARELYLLSDNQLEDIGISRELLKLGAKGYPWREEIAKEIPNNVTTLNTAKAVDSTPVMPRRPKAA